MAMSAGFIVALQGSLASGCELDLWAQIRALCWNRSLFVDWSAVPPDKPLQQTTSHASCVALLLNSIRDVSNRMML